jgi:hypothetical protein
MKIGHKSRLKSKWYDHPPRRIVKGVIDDTRNHLTRNH